MTKVVEKKLGRYKAYAIIPAPLTRRSRIEIDPRQKPKSYLNSLIHEKLHLIFADLSESKVNRTATQLTNLLWENNYRKTMQ